VWKLAEKKITVCVIFVAPLERRVERNKIASCCSSEANTNKNNDMWCCVLFPLIRAKRGKELLCWGRQRNSFGARCGEAEEGTESLRLNAQPVLRTLLAKRGPGGRRISKIAGYVFIFSVSFSARAQGTPVTQRVKPVAQRYAAQLLF
jgi:hypothetical protein